MDAGIASTNGKLYIFAGRGEGPSFGHDRKNRANDLHEYHISSQSWSDLSTPTSGNPPSPRSMLGFAAWNGR
eukprot:3021871-Rhodomonas_salina.1